MLDYTDVKRILEDGSAQMLSLYLMVDPAIEENQATQPAWRIWLKNALNDIEAGLDGDDKRIWKEVRGQLDEYMRLYKANSKSLALFASADDLQVFELPVPILQNRAAFGEPLVGPLLWVMDEYERYLIVQVDREKASFISAYMGSAGESERIELDIDDYDFGQKTLMPSTGNRGGRITEGSNRDAFEDMIDAHIARFYRDVAERTRELKEQLNVSRIIMCGSEQSAHAVYDLLHESIQKAVIHICSMPMRYSPAEVLQHIQPAALEFERKHEMALVEEVVDFAKSGGRGALGRDGVLAALEQQRVELLLVPWPMRYDDFADSLPIKAMQSNSRIELVRGDAAQRLNEEGGLAARLYYAIQPATENG